jgi:hypothetical protein
MAIAVSPSLPLTARVLPEPVQRWLGRTRPVPGGAPRAIYLEGPARFKRGRLPYLPLDIRTWTRLGFDRVSELEVRIAGLTIMRGFDAFVDGRGFTRVGSEVSLGPSVDQGAFHVMFLETLLVPSAWPEGIGWEPIDADSARVVTQFGGGQETAVVGFDQATGLPSSYQTKRYRAAGQPKVPWTASVGTWRDFGSLVYPSRFEATWADEARPWLKMRIDRATRDPSMDEPLERAREALKGVAA